jgi:hypothetical protein
MLWCATSAFRSFCGKQNHHIRHRQLSDALLVLPPPPYPGQVEVRMMRTLIAGRDFSGQLSGSLDIHAHEGIPGATLGRPLVVIIAGGKDGQRLIVAGDQLIDAETL